jgi:hypothetical protein
MVFHMNLFGKVHSKPRFTSFNLLKFNQFKEIDGTLVVYLICFTLTSPTHSYVTV